MPGRDVLPEPSSSLEPSNTHSMTVLLEDDIDESPLEDHEISTETENAERPPALLAARLSHNRATARRKSSAASSRCNSLSSKHSHASSRGHYRSSSMSQSSHVAQHLRRNSIIENRRARLADRAAHVEQVRLRAALAKAMPRGSITVSEERAQAAQIAKEKYLAKVAATCAEEVARAKRIAETVKERKSAAEARQRLEIEEKHAEVEKRRARYQRDLQDRRAKKVDATVKKLAVVDELEFVEALLDEPAAAARIQRAWRQSQRRAVIHAFNALRTRFDSTTEDSHTFESMTAFVAEPDVISKTTALLVQLGLQGVNDSNAALNTRTFLSAFLITRYPEEILNSVAGAHEHDVMQKAKDLLHALEVCLAGLAPWNDHTPCAFQRETLSQVYSSYTSAFAAWKLQDSSVLIEGMVASFVELDAIWQAVKDDTRGDVAEDYREGIRDNQVMLLSRIRKLAGADRADTLIKKAIRESRRLRPKKRPVAEIRPRGVENAALPPVSPNDDSDAAVDTVLPRFDDLNSSEITRKLFSPMPSNRVLTHELAIDKDYRLADNAVALREEVYSAVCDAMRQGFEAGEGNAWTISAAENIREKLLRMLRPGNSMYVLVSEALDLQHIRQQCEARVFSYNRFFGFMGSILPKLCAPFRDAEIATVAEALQSEDDELNDMIGKLFKLLRAVDLLSLDHSNFMLMTAAPMLIREAAGYEARQFAADLESGRGSLTRARRWYKRHHQRLEGEAARRDPEGVSRDAIENTPKLGEVYAKGLVELATELDQLSHDQVPETLDLDVTRLRDLRTRTCRVVVVGAILLTAKNLLKRDVRGQWRNESVRLWQLFSTLPFSSSSTPSSNNLSTSTTAISSSSSDTPLDDANEPSTVLKAFSILDSAHNIPPASKTQLVNAIARFCSQAALAVQTGRFTDPVLKVLVNRVRTHVLQRIAAQTSTERVRAASSAADHLTACGLGELTSQIGGVVDVLERIRAVDLQAHRRWYEEICANVDHEEE